MGRIGYRLEIKSAGNKHYIYMVTASDTRLICQVMTPADGMMRADVEMLDNMVRELKKRLNKSI